MNALRWTSDSVVRTETESYKSQNWIVKLTYLDVSTKAQIVCLITDLKVVGVASEAIAKQ
jgi:hypothetical protein